MLVYALGGLIGGVLGYFVLYRLIGCSDKGCAITANPYISTIFGAILGVLLVSVIAPSSGPFKSGGDTQAAGSEYRRMTAEEAKARIDSGDDVIIVDVRTAEEYNAGHIPNAVLIPNETITDKMPGSLPDLNAEILIYCRSGNRSAQAARKLIAMGYTNVYDFGGIIDWPYGIVVR